MKLIFFYLEILLLKYYINILNKVLVSKIYLKSNKHNITKKVLLSKIFEKLKKNQTYIKVLFIKRKGHFGNYFISINNAIIYCEYLGCQKLIIEHNNEIFINNTIFYKKYNFTIEPNQTINYLDTNLIILNWMFFFYNNFKYSKNAIRFHIFKRQFLNNLPKILSHPNDLYIYIRGGDIFKEYKHSITRYPQPPLCFYMKILDKFQFREVFIISEDKLNPVISELLQRYSYIKYKKNNLKLDLSYLANAYNIAAGKSSFLMTIIKLNEKLKYLWDYDFYQLSERYLHLHYSVYKYSFYFTIYKMNSSKRYRKIMHRWINSPKQRKIMIKEKCQTYFDIIRGRY